MYSLQKYTIRAKVGEPTIIITTVTFKFLCHSIKPPEYLVFIFGMIMLFLFEGDESDEGVSSV